MRYVFVPDRLTDRSSRHSDPARRFVSVRDRHLTTSCPLRREPTLPGVPAPTPSMGARGMSTRHRNAAAPALPLPSTAVRAAPHQSIDRHAPPLTPAHLLPIGFSHPIGESILARTPPTPGRSINHGHRIRAAAAPKRGMTTSVAHALGAVCLASFLFPPAALPATKPALTTRSTYTNATPPRNRCYRTGQGQMPVTGP